MCKFQNYILICVMCDRMIAKCANSKTIYLFNLGQMWYSFNIFKYVIQMTTLIIFMIFNKQECFLLLYVFFNIYISGTTMNVYVLWPYVHILYRFIIYTSLHITI